MGPRKPVQKIMRPGYRPPRRAPAALVRNGRNYRPTYDGRIYVYSLA
jgi:hypothetical protein